MAKIIFEREKCLGCGTCQAVCPKYWQLSEDGKSRLLGSKKNEKTGNFELEIKEFECNQEAANLCPAQCIKIGT